MHGGASTGHRTPEGRERSKRARWKHGSYSLDAERAFQRLKVACQAFNVISAARYAAMIAGMRRLLQAQRRDRRNQHRRRRDTGRTAFLHRVPDANRVLDEIRRVAFADVRRLFDEAGHLKPISEWTDDDRAGIASIRVARRISGIDFTRERMTTSNGGDTKVVSEEALVNVRFASKVQALEVLAKSLGMFKDRAKGTGRMTLEELIAGSIKKPPASG